MLARRTALIATLLLSMATSAQPQINLDAIEKSAGQQFIENLKRTRSECRSSHLSSFHEQILSALIAKGIIKKAPDIYIFNLRQINAFAGPAGKIIITAPLLIALRSSEEYAGILLHEIGHVALGHIRQNMLMQTARSLFLSHDAVKFSGWLASLKYSRSQELEADGFAAKAMLQIGIPASALNIALLRIKGNTDEGNSDLFRTHPLTQDRLTALRNINAAPVATAIVALPPWRDIDLKCG